MSDPSVPTLSESTEHAFGDLLVQAGKLTARDLERALAAQQELGGALSTVLTQLGLVSEVDVARARSSQLGIAFVAADEFPEIPLEVDGLRSEFMTSHQVCPVRLESGRLDVAMAFPEDMFVRKALQIATGLEIRPFIALPSDIEKALAQPAEAGDVDGADTGLGDDSGDFVEHLRDLASEAPVIRLVNLIIGRVIELRASDIHLEPFDDGLHVRYRVDGVIHSSELVPPRHSAAVSSRVKLLAHLDIA